MIIQCEQCQTKFRLDDSKVADKGIKVRCAKCRHVFSVAQTPPVPEDSASLWQDETDFPSEAEQEFATPLQESELDFEPEPQQQDLPSEPTALFGSADFALPEAQPTPFSAVPDDDDAGFTFPSMDSVAVDDRAQTPEAPDEMDFGAFDFGDASTAAEDTVTAAPSKEGFGGLDFSGDDIFGEVVNTTSAKESQDSISFDLGIDGFADSMGVKSGTARQSTSFATHDMAAENPFSLDDVDFGDELTSVAVQQVSTEELKPSQDLLFAPMAATKTLPMADRTEEPPAKTSAAQEELPPLSIASRRKESPRISGMLVLLGVMIAGLILFYSYWGYVTLTEDKGKLSQQETGRITLRSVEASFVKNKILGDLLVISGEAVNEYNKPRAAIQIKGIVFGADGQEVASKNVFCGNPLTEAQLTSMSMDKIEAAMANQFGDSLANMEVAPGDAIAFVIVIPKPPAGATDYGVEPAGSTMATGKVK